MQKLARGDSGVNESRFDPKACTAPTTPIHFSGLVQLWVSLGNVPGWTEGPKETLVQCFRLCPRPVSFPYADTAREASNTDVMLSLHMHTDSNAVLAQELLYYSHLENSWRQKNQLFMVRCPTHCNH